MSWTELALAAIGLLGVALGSVLNRWNGTADRKARLAEDRAAQSQATEQEAILELLAATRLLAQRANGFRMTVKLLQSHAAKRDRRTGVLAPLDVDAAFDRLVDADQQLGRASAKVWLHAGPEAIRLTNTVVHAAAAVFDAHSDTPQRGPRALVRSLQLRYTTALPGRAALITTTSTALATANKTLAEYARDKYGLEYVDLFQTTRPEDGSPV